MDGCTDIKRCNMDSDGQMERGEIDRRCVDGKKVIRGMQVNRRVVSVITGLKNVCNIPLLLWCMLQGLLSDVVILQKALSGLQRYQTQPSERDTAAVSCWVSRQHAVCHLTVSRCSFHADVLKSRRGDTSQNM